MGTSEYGNTHFRCEIDDQQQRPDVNPVWLHLLAETASSVAGLRVLPEPKAPTPLRASNGRAKLPPLSGARS